MALSQREQQALEAVLERSSVDHDFRRQLLEDPRRVIQDSFGILIPADFRIRFVEKDPEVDALVVLPDFKASGDELSDRDLEHVSGGTEGFTWSPGSGGTGGG